MDLNYLWYRSNSNLERDNLIITLFLINCKLVWYVAYGSNLLKDRFITYIIGGKPEGAQKDYSGSKDNSYPRQIKSKIINYKLYFAKNSSVWNGGVCFLNSKRDMQIRTYARMYLITKDQLTDVAKQETDTSYDLIIDFKEAIKVGFYVFKRPSWYGKLLFLGYDSLIPMFTLTSESDDLPVTKPSIPYLTTIIQGLSQSFRLNKLDITGYLLEKNGISGEYTKSEIDEIVNQTFDNK